MKALCTLVLLWLALPCVLGQGIFTFNPLLTPRAPVTLADGSGPGPSMIAGVYLVRDDQLELLQAIPFRTNPAEGMKYAYATTLIVPGIPAHAAATFRVRVWPVRYATYEAALAAGACCGEYPTVSGTGAAYIPALGWDPPPVGTAPSIYPNLEGLLPLDLPCVLAKGSTTNLLPAVKLTGRQITNGFKLQVFTGFVSKTNLLQSSTNLLSWLNVATNVPSTNRYVIEDAPSPGQRPRYYRALVPQQ